jgi:hypothetical protein
MGAMWPALAILTNERGPARRKEPPAQLCDLVLQRAAAGELWVTCGSIRQVLAGGIPAGWLQPKARDAGRQADGRQAAHLAQAAWRDQMSPSIHCLFPAHHKQHRQSV